MKNMSLDKGGIYLRYDHWVAYGLHTYGVGTLEEYMRVHFKFSLPVGETPTGSEKMHAAISHCLVRKMASPR